MVSNHKPLTQTKQGFIPQNASLFSNDDILKVSKAIANKTSVQTDAWMKTSTYQKVDEVITGGLEAGATLITGSTTGLLGRTIGVAQGLSKSIMLGEFGTNKGASIVEQEALKLQSAVTYSPKTKKGQSYLKQIGGFLAPLEAIPIVTVEASVIGNSTRIAWGSQKVFDKSGTVAPKGINIENKVANVAGITARKTNEVGVKDSIPTINGRKTINSEYAGKVHPSGVKFKDNGFPDFTPHSKAEVKIDGLTGNYTKDAAMVNNAVGLKSTPDGYVWHHVEDRKTMQLVPRDIHNATRHTGGSAIIRNGGFD